jgi:hypothetical protein
MGFPKSKLNLKSYHVFLQNIQIKELFRQDSIAADHVFIMMIRQNPPLFFSAPVGGVGDNGEPTFGYKSIDMTQEKI